MLQPVLTAVSALLILISVILVFTLWSHRGWVKAWLKGSFGFIFLAIAIFLAFALMDIWSYRQLLKEQPLATLSIYQLGDQTYDITVIEEGKGERRYKVRGDQWQLDARLFTWQGPLASIGMKPLYRLDRLSGRYLSLEQERTATRSVYEIGQSTGLDVWKLLNNMESWLDAKYGSAVYMPMANGAVFSVHLTAKGLIARPINEVAEDALSSW